MLFFQSALGLNNAPLRNNSSTMIKHLYGICEAYLFDVKIGKIRKLVRYKKDMAREKKKGERIFWVFLFLT